MAAMARCSAVTLLLAVGCMLALAPACLGHGFLTTPLSRGRVLNYADWEIAGGNGLGRPHRTYPDGTAMNDQADVCGDPHQDVIENGGWLNIANRPANIQATYSAGQTISVTWKMNTQHGGWIGISICPTTRSGATQGCFDSYRLTNVNTNTNRFWLLSNQGSYTTSWRLPAGVTCDGGCMLQATYRTANSCVDYCEAWECGSGYAARNNLIVSPQQFNLDRCGSQGAARAEVFRDCADIRITGSSTPAPTTPAPTTSAPTGGVCDKCNVAVCRGGCKCDTNCACRPSLGGSVCDKCNIAQSEGGCKCDSNCNCISGTCWF